MGKRSTIVLLDDDDDDTDFSISSDFSRARSKSKAKSVPVSSRRRAKKVRVTEFSARPSKLSNGFDEIKRFCEDLDEEFSDFQLSSGFGRSNKKDLWVDKYKPHSLEELAVHKKKVEEVQVWFDERLGSQKKFHDNVLIINGPAGVGKSAAIHVIASHLGATVCEWNTPTPTVWQEHVHNSMSGIRYLSKLDEFQNFVEKATKYGLIPSSPNGGSKTPNILLVDDLPVASGKVAYERLNKCLHHLVQSALLPTVILITDYTKGDSSESSPMNWEELQLSLQRAGACKVSFNPITVNAIKKTLTRICREEHCNVDSQQIDLIAKASGGDIRHAITSLQYFCVRPRPGLSVSISNGTSNYSKGRSNEMSHLGDGSPLPFGRDETLSLFHALGKFLHNKREMECSISVDHEAFLLKDKLARLNLKMDAPEKVLCKAYGQARPVADFLHENVLDFVSEDAMDDAFVVCMYLSDADFLLGSLSGMPSRNYEAENVLQSSAASVAVRGVLFGNSHPSPSRWHTIRRPSLWQVERSYRQNKLKLVNEGHIAYDGQSLSDFSVVVTELKPALKWLGFRQSKGNEDGYVPGKDKLLDSDSWSETSLDQSENETTDDEIEDW